MYGVELMVKVRESWGEGHCNTVLGEVSLGFGRVFSPISGFYVMFASINKIFFQVWLRQCGDLQALLFPKVNKWN